MKTNNTGKRIAIILACIAGVCIAAFAFLFSVFDLTRKLYDIVQVQETETGEPSEEHGKEADEDFDENPQEGSSKENGETSDQYYEFHDEIKKDLSYEIRFSDFNPELDTDKNIRLEMNYPVVYSDDKDNLEKINNAIQEELHDTEDYVIKNAEYLSDEDLYEFKSEAYVTYMSEDILSIAYLEYGYLNDVRLESYVISINIDMETGMKMTNTQLLDIDDEFSIDFRKRCEKQNGEIQELLMFTDQNITEYLTGKSLIIFYTPLGMEVGFNYSTDAGTGWVTVTYKDYQDYQKQF